MSECLYKIRPLSEPDLKEVLANEQEAYGFPWKLSHFEECLKAGYPSSLLEINNLIVGHGIICVAAGESHLLNLVIKQGFQHQGWGGILLNKLLDLAVQHKANVMFLEVRPSNQAAIGLYTRAGFTEIGRRKYYYPSLKGREDAIVMRKTLLPQ